MSIPRAPCPHPREPVCRWCQRGESRLSHQQPVPTRACCVFPAHPTSTVSALPLYGPSVSSSMGSLIHSGGAGEGWPHVSRGTPALACLHAQPLHPACWAGCRHGDDLSRDSIGPPPPGTDPWVRGLTGCPALCIIWGRGDGLVGWAFLLC